MAKAWKFRRKYKLNNPNREEIKPSRFALDKYVKREAMFLMITVIVIMVILFSSAYAVFTSMQKANDYNIVKAGTLEIAYQDYEEGLGNIINLNGAFPISDSEGMELEPYVFRVKNIGSLPAKYSIGILDDLNMILEDNCESNQLPKDKIKVNIDDIEPMLLSSVEELEYIIFEGMLKPEETREHSIRIWIDEEAGNEVLGTHYHGMIKIEGEVYEGSSEFGDYILVNETGNVNINQARLSIENKKQPDFTKTSTDDNTHGLYAALDDDGMSYYFRGNVETNYVKFAGFFWRIIRINGDGSIRLIYDGTSAHANGVSSTNRQIGTSTFSSVSVGNTRVGYMFGDSNKMTVTSTSTNVGAKSFVYAGLSATTDYYFGTSYTSDLPTRSLILSGTVTSGTIAPDKVGLYTCMSTSSIGTCTRFYKIIGYNSATSVTAEVLGFNLINRSDTIDNVSNSSIKTYTDNWYNSNLLSYDHYMSKDSTYCNDRGISSYSDATYQNIGYGSEPTMYSYPRFNVFAGSTIGNPRLTCSATNDKFSTTALKGNGKLTRPIGHLTADEANMAGARSGTANTSFYLYTGNNFWTMTPGRVGEAFDAGVFNINSTGALSSNSIASGSYNVRPVINLIGDIEFSGNGTIDDPYVIP